jgi:hypothetical protein
MTIAELIERVEAASGPARDIDGDIALMEGWTLSKMKGDGQAYWRKPGATEYWDRCTDGPPDYTRSIDAALALAERKLGVNWYGILLDAVREFGTAGTLGPEHLARYVVVAILRALQASDPTNAGGER